MTPGHEALALVRELVNLIDSSPMMQAAVGASRALSELAARARGVELASNDTLMAVRPGAAEVAWCGQCRAFHAKPDRVVMRDVPGEVVRPDTATINGKDHAVRGGGS